MRKKLWMVIIAVLLLSSVGLFADNGKLLLSAHYNLPLNNQEIDESLDFGIGYRFWGIFAVSANMYTEILYGADNIFNISRIVPIGLVSGGFGMRIPLGGLDLIMDWHQFFTIIGTGENFRPYCESFKFGGAFHVGDNWSIEVYNRKLINFTADSGITADQVNFLGVGVGFDI